MIADRTLSRDDFPFPLDSPLRGQDLLQLLPGLLQPVWSQTANAVRATTTTVSAVKTGPKRVTVTADGQAYDARYLDTYTPTVGDTVIVLHNAAQAVVLGRLA